MTVAVVSIVRPCEEHGCSEMARYRVRYLTSPVMRFEFCQNCAAARVVLSEVDVTVEPLVGT